MTAFFSQMAKMFSIEILNYNDYSEPFLFRKELVYWYADNIFNIHIFYHYYSNHT